MRRGPTDSAFLDLVDVVDASTAVEPILSPDIRAGLRAWLTEIWADKELAAMNVKPRRSCLLTGPPGCGKTTLAHHLAVRLDLQMAVVRTDTVRSTFLGESAKNIGTIFRGAEEANMVLFFDEFDTVAVSRTAHGVHEEDKKTTNTVLTHVERCRQPFIAATNLGKTLDSAIQRRFDLAMEIKLPRPEEAFLIVGLWGAPLDLEDQTRDELARALRNAPPALIRNVMEGIKRYLVISPKLGMEQSISACLRAVTATVKPHEEFGAVPLYMNQDATIRAVEEAWPEWPPRILQPEKDGK